MFSPLAVKRDPIHREVSTFGGGTLHESFERGPFFLVSSPNQLTVFDVYTRRRFYLFTHTTI